MIHVSYGSIIIKNGTFKVYSRTVLSCSYSTVVIEGGLFERTFQEGTGCQHCLVCIASSSMAITGGRFNGAELHISNCNGLEEDSAVKISGVTINISDLTHHYGGIWSIGTDLVLADSTITVTTPTRHAVLAGKAGTLTIESGTYEGTKAIVSDSAYTSVTIIDGVFTGTAYSLRCSYASVYDGTFSGALSICDFSNITDENITLYGGTYDNDPTSYLADGYSCTTLEDDSGTTWYTVVKDE